MSFLFAFNHCRRIHVLTHINPETKYFSSNLIQIKPSGMKANAVIQQPLAVMPGSDQNRPIGRCFLNSGFRLSPE